MKIALGIILLIGSTSFCCTDLESSSGLTSSFMPIMFVNSLVCLALWIVALVHHKGMRQTDHVNVGSHLAAKGPADCNVELK